jgi:hypothetical protein
MSDNSYSKNPSEYEGKLIGDNLELKNALIWCLDILDHCEPFKPSHEGPCSPMATPCDGECVGTYYFYKELDRIRSLIKTEIQ